MKKLLSFILTAFGFSWSIAALLHFGGGLGQPMAQLYMFLFMLGPAIGAINCALVFDKGRRLEALGLRGGFNKWLIWAWLIAIAIVGGALVISVLPESTALQNPVLGLKAQIAAMGTEVPPAMDEPWMMWLVIASAVTMGAAINTPLLLSEELGWRGWVWDHLRPAGFWKATGITGLLWGIWHAPIIAMGYNYPSLSGGSAVLLFIVFCIIFSPIFSYVREKSGSVWAACVLHGTINALAGVALMAQTSADMPWRGVVGIGGLLILAATAIFVWIQMKGQNHVRS